MKKKTFVGFGFGAIQSGLMIYEAMASGGFDEFIVAEVDQSLVDRVRRNGSSVTINIARADGIEKASISGISIFNPAVPEDRESLSRGIERADEMATAVPSVSLYSAGGDSSVAALLARNINPEKPQILYAAENDIRAAEILEEKILVHSSPDRLRNFQILDTVIGKMSGVIDDPEEISRLNLAPMTPEADRAILVEEFNRILVSRVRIPGLKRAIPVFEEKDDLLPFEEAKLYGHNAVHALLGYHAHRKGYAVMSEIRNDGELMNLGREAFLRESGAALIRKHASLGDPLFTREGYAGNAEDLLARMTNPFLNDKVARICRDPVRKLGCSDRLVGTMRVAFEQGIVPRIMAGGVLAALEFILREGVGLPGQAPDRLDKAFIRDTLSRIWEGEAADELNGKCLELVLESLGETKI